MRDYIIMFRSLTYAQRAAALLERSGITASVTRAPREVMHEGCGYCVKVSQKRFELAVKQLRKLGQKYGATYVRLEDGGYAEVRI